MNSSFVDLCFNPPDVFNLLPYVHSIGICNAAPIQLLYWPGAQPEEIEKKGTRSRSEFIRNMKSSKTINPLFIFVHPHYACDSVSYLTLHVYTAEQVFVHFLLYFQLYSL